MNSNDDRSGLNRRALARRLAAVAAAASLRPALLLAAESNGAEVSDALAAHVAAALSASPAVLTPQQRLEVRNGVRELQKILAQARSRELPNEADPAFIFHTVVTP
jgi:hypothetical protein